MARPEPESLRRFREERQALARDNRQEWHKRADAAQAAILRLTGLPMTVGPMIGGLHIGLDAAERWIEQQTHA